MKGAKISYAIAPLSTAILLCGAGIEAMDTQVVPMNLPALREFYTKDSNPYLQITFDGIKDINRMRTLQRFASELLNNTVDLEPDIIAMVDRKFWELI
jgi:hypothetical protein